MVEPHLTPTGYRVLAALVAMTLWCHLIVHLRRWVASLVSFNSASSSMLPLLCSSCSAFCNIVASRLVGLHSNRRTPRSTSAIPCDDSCDASACAAVGATVSRFQLRFCFPRVYLKVTEKQIFCVFCNYACLLLTMQSTVC